jgi:arsenate reductase (thioredoxin)
VGARLAARLGRGGERGLVPGPSAPAAIEAMAEAGIDISAHRSKPLADVAPETADVIVTLCAEEICPYIPGPVQRLHWPIPDPVAEGDLAAFRTARDRIKTRVEELVRRTVSTSG